MERLLGLIGMSVGGWIGWALGDVAGTFAAFVVSMVGAGVGLYLAREFADRYRP